LFINIELEFSGKKKAIARTDDLDNIRGFIQKFPDWLPGALGATVSLFCESV
jgi:hypothetical protein